MENNDSLLNAILNADSINTLMTPPIAPLRGDSIRRLRSELIAESIVFDRYDTLDMDIVKDMCNRSTAGEYLKKYEGDSFADKCTNILYKLQFITALCTNRKEITALIEQFTVG